MAQIQINELIAQSVSNATARRNQAIEAEETLVSLSDEQATDVKGGLLKPVTTIGFILCPPIVVGLIAYPPIKTTTL
ncbi:MAG: hypothetical protein Fur006_40940 [Coleofasciculaceae cyanobacterium]